MVPRRRAVTCRATWVPRRFRATWQPGGTRDCKGVLTRARPHGQPCKETVDQAPLASIFDMKMAREHADSFDKFYRDIMWLMTAQN